MRTLNKLTCSPIMPYYGGKTLHVDWINSYLPRSATAYIEGFAGSAAVGLSRPPCSIEIFNDFDPGVANLYRVLQTDAEELRRRLRFTLHSRREHALCSGEEAARCRTPVADPVADPIEWARRHLVLIRQSFGAGFDGSWSYKRETGGNAFASVGDLIPPAAHRLRNAKIENLHFKDLIHQYDFGPDGLSYFDPPYVPETRVAKKVYSCEMTVEEHELLLTLMNAMSGMVVLSGYRSNLYDQALGDWRRVERSVAVLASNVSARSGTMAKPRRTECLWINPAAQERLRQEGRL